jgi:hypothetical protein
MRGCSPVRRILTAASAILVALAIIVSAIVVLTPTASAAGGSWIITDMGASNAKETDIAIDSNGHPHIIYTYSGFKLAEWTGAAWSTTTLVVGGSPGSVEIELDALDRPHIGYTISNTNVVHKFWDGTAWITQTVATNCTTNYNNLGFTLDNDGRPGFVYGAGASMVIYAHWNGAAWTYSKIASGSIKGMALDYDSSNNPHAFYALAGGSYTGSLAIWTGSAWDIHATSKTPMQAALVCNGNIDQVVLDAADLFLCTWNGAAWNYETVDTSSNNYNSPLGLVLYSNGDLGVSWYDWDAKNADYAVRSGTTWTNTIIESTGDIGQCSSVALDPDGYPHLTYFDATNAKLKYARYQANAWAPAFTTTSVTAVGITGSYSYAPQLNETGTISATSYPAWMSWNGATLSGSPNSLGSWQVSFTGTSTAGTLSTTQTFTVTVGGWASSFTSTPPISVVLNHAYSYTPALNVTGTISALGIPSWATWDGTTLSGTPTQQGSWSVSLTATGPGLLTAYQNWTVSTSQWAPIFTNTPAYGVVENSAYSFTPQINETGTISVVSKPAWLSWSGGTLSGMPSGAQVGTWAVSFSATGSGGLTGWLNYSVTVSAIPVWAPSVSSSPATAVTEGDPYSYTVVANESVTIIYSGASWLTLNSQALSGTAPLGAADYQVSLRIQSVQGTLAIYQNWSIEVTAPAILPEISSTPVTTGTECTPISTPRSATTRLPSGPSRPTPPS